MLFLITYCYAKPGIVFDKVIHNFGTVKTETSVKHTFHFRNTGKSTLIIERIKAG
jgi:hypothetical protein